MINILFNVDNNYISQCKAVMRSIKAHTNSNVCFYICGAEKSNFEGFNVVCLNPPDISIIKEETNYKHLTSAACYRLFAPYILPKLDKVIYLDCDLIVLDDIKKLWDFDIDYIGGVQDPMFISQANKNNLKTLYINSGVMVLNLKNLRKLNYIERIINTQKKGYNLSLLDQDIINIAFGDVIEHLPLKWNVYAKIYPETTCDMIKARNNPSIIHWCGYAKPWVYEEWKCEEWRHYDSIEL